MVRAVRPDIGAGGLVSAIEVIERGGILLQRPCAPVVATFRDWPEIEAYYSVTGPIDTYMVVRVDTTQALSGLVHKLSATPGVALVHSAVIM